MTVRLAGYDSVYSGPHIVLVRPEWRPHILEDLLGGFASVSDRKVVSGRVEHFSYEPKGAPGRVIVRELARGGLARFAGNFHLGLSRIIDELNASAQAMHWGVHVPEIVACRATHVIGPFYRFTMVVREIAGARDLLSLEPSERRRSIDAIAVEIRRLHDSSIYHGDLNLRNILLQGEQVYLIDFDRASVCKNPRPNRAIANLARLNRSIEKWLGGRVSKIDKLRFLLKYAKREEVADLSRRCESGLGFHRLWWSLTGHRA